MNNKLKISVQWMMDGDPDLDFLGKCVDSVFNANCYIDRKHNILVDKMMTITVMHFNTTEDYDTYIEELDYLGIDYSDNTVFNEDDPNDVSYEILHSYYEFLPYKCDWRGTSSFQYIVSTNFKNPMGNEEEYKYIIQDVKRLEDYWRGKWNMEGCVAVAYLDDIELASDACYGYESDMGKDEKKIIENGHIEECKFKALEVLKKLSKIDIDNIETVIKLEEFQW